VPDRHSVLDQLRAANERLVVASMRAQERAERAEAVRADAEAANRLKDEFLAIVSHELRTPLSAILGWSRLLGAGLLDPARATHAIHTIERNAKALARIIDDILDLSRVIGGHVRIEPEAVDLVAVIQGALDEVRLAADARGLHLTFTYPNAPDPIAGDAVRVQQVVANLLSNAVKFTPPNGHVEVRLTRRGAEAEIRVEDTGQGIAPDFLPRVFDPFAQADASTTRRHGGLGLGLAIVKALVERHGGTVRAESPGPGRGATFTVRLPVLAGHGAAEAEPAGEPAGTTSAAAPVRLDGVRVVLVEDDPDVRHMLTVLLELAGAAVVSCGAVGEALEALDATRADVIVSDIAMADEDGFTLIRRLRARDAAGGGAVPAVALTGYVRPEDRASVLGAGFQAHVRKPVQPDELVATIAALAARSDE
jgi:CheY-like chemotaxis protein